MNLNVLHAALSENAKDNCVTIEEAFKQLKKYHKQRNKFVARLALIKTVSVNPHLYSLNESENGCIKLTTSTDILSYLDSVHVPCKTISIDFADGSSFNYEQDICTKRGHCDDFILQFCLDHM